MVHKARLSSPQSCPQNKRRKSCFHNLNLLYKNYTPIGSINIRISFLINYIDSHVYIQWGNFLRKGEGFS
jgi:hypothetical protein